MHQGLLHLEARGTEREKQAVSALRAIEEILVQEDISANFPTFEDGVYIHGTQDLLPNMEMVWTYEPSAAQVKISLWFKDNPDRELVLSAYIRLDLKQGKWFLGLERNPESSSDSVLGSRIFWKNFKLSRPGVEQWIPEDRIFSEILPAMIQIFNTPPHKLSR